MAPFKELEKDEPLLSQQVRPCDPHQPAVGALVFIPPALYSPLQGPDRCCMFP